MSSMLTLSVSVVCYASNCEQLDATLHSVIKAVQEGKSLDCLNSAVIFLVDNGPDKKSTQALVRLSDKYKNNLPSYINLSVIGSGINYGFGVGHNLAIKESSSDFHLILNPDVFVANDALAVAVSFFASRPDVGLVVPDAYGPDGSRQYLCKRYPTVLDLALRGFAPRGLRTLFSERLHRYEMRDVIGDEVVLDPAIVSGCFMLFRASVLKRLGGFDSRYFLYFEDFDLSLRAVSVTHIAYLPSMKIVHHGGDAARKGLRHIYFFVRSGMTFFRTHGWRFW